MRNRKYSEEFRREAVQMLLAGRAAKELAADLGVSYWELLRWRKEYRSETAGQTVGAVDQNEELKRIRRELQDLKMENAILKKYAAILSKDQFGGNSRS